MDSSSSQATLPAEPSVLAPRPTFSQEQEAMVFRAAARRVTAAVHREPAESTSNMLGDVAYTPVYGAFVTLRRAGKLRSCCGHIELPVSLSKALDSAADRAATEDPRFPPIAVSELGQLDMDVWILWGPELVQARGEDRVQAVTIGKHGLLIAKGRCRGLLLPGVAVEHHFDALTFLQQTCVKAGLPTDAWKDDDTQVQVFEGSEICGRLQPQVPDDRQPAVAGAFYPGSASEVKYAVEQLFASAKNVAQESWAGAMVPHAGWMYSGRLAAATLARVAVPQTAIVLCPKHRVHGARWAVAPHGRWLFPGGALASDQELAGRLASGVEGLELDAAAHRDEHAIEVQLPLLAHVAPNVRIVGITVGDSTLPELLRFGAAMANVLRDMPERPLLIVSSDMNHFADEMETQRLDRLALEAIHTLDPTNVYDVVRKNRISMCGAAPCVVAMETLRRLDSLNRCEAVGHTTSADVSGDTSRVVGYAGLLFGA